jgi:hypothetical protein
MTTLTTMPIGAYLPIPFALRWRKELDDAIRQRGWHVHAAGSHQGKSAENRHCYLEHIQAAADAGRNERPVAMAWATDNKLIVRSIAESLGGRLFAQQRHIELRVPDAIKRLNTKLIIVNNGHNMDWRQWNELLTLDDICWTLHGIHVGVVLSGVHQKLGIVNQPKQRELVEQITQRIKCFKQIPGHDRAEVKRALELIMTRDDPALLQRGALDQAGLAFELLTGHALDPARTKRVAAVHLFELVARMSALNTQRPRTSVEEIVRSAFAHYMQHRLTATTPTNPVAALAALPQVP